eukprot:CAMPEP_0184355570 /NCGR_PEP_ID=MMETSP1089-20130417/96915_1 /TAXON_ID=38269 ORGANISM="Gloeochaete wittrockiana, Strain SAG46.84" /NCGR_SAMPLE_ID=MMETSP1089 /ASSEMBLY_ACC=CAM_ASM_000445 /LENGTH=105 /DNA_ID=CAMNT_0026692313 /DNA_START=44 /DNA_END=361 /DNA_ORIENTATION=+
MDKIRKDNPNAQFSFEDFVLNLEVGDKLTMRIFELLIKDMITRAEDGHAGSSSSSSSSSSSGSAASALNSQSPFFNLLQYLMPNLSNSQSGGNLFVPAFVIHPPS